MLIYNYILWYKKNSCILGNIDQIHWEYITLVLWPVFQSAFMDFSVVDIDI